jgi:outer membrane protein assembly factor BamD (BamD/ComL family)
MNKIFRIYILLALFSATGVFAFADEPRSAFDDKFSADTTAILKEQAILRRNQEREERAREYYEKGLELTNAGKLDEARGYFEKAILIIKHPEMAGYINESQQQLKKQETSVVQQQAIEIEHQQKEAEASRQQQKALQEQRREEEVEHKKQEAARGHELEIKALQHKKDLEQAQWQFDEQQRQVEEQRRYQQEALEQKQRQFDEEVNGIYTSALDRYKVGDVEGSKEEFLRVNEKIPNYKSTQEYLSKIEKIEDKMKQAQADRLLAQQRQEEEQKRQQQEQQVQQKNQFELEVNGMYIAALKLYRAGDFRGAKAEFLKVDEKISGYEFTQRYLSKIDQDIIMADTLAAKRVIEIEHQQKEAEASRQQQEALQEQRWEEEAELKKQEARRQHELEVKVLQHKKDLEDQAQFLYQAAVNLFNNKAMDEALEKFNDIENTYPGFKSTRVYIAHIKQWQSDEQQRQVEEQKRQQREAQEQQRRQFDEEVNRIYTSALDRYKVGDVEGSKEEFLKVNEKIINYKSTRWYLSKITKIENEIKQAQADRLLEEQRREEEQKRQQQEQQVRQRHQFELEVNGMYIAALKRYRAHDFEASKEEFLEVNKEINGYELTQKYLSKIKKIEDKMKQDQEDRLLAQQRQAQEEQRRQQQQAQIRQKHQFELEVNGMYIAALKLYRAGDFRGAKAEFLKVDEKIPGYEFTQRYLSKIDQELAALKPVVVVSPAPVKATPVPVAVVTTPAPSAQKGILPVQDKRPQGGDIANLDVISALAEKSAQLYRQIAGIADDRTTMQIKKKMAEVDEILNNLKEDKEHFLRQMHEEQWRRQQEELKTKQEERNLEAEKMYQGGGKYLRSHDYAKAKVKFLALENIIPDYKATHRYLSRIEEYQKQARVEALIVQEQKEAEHSKQLQNKENAGQLRRAQKEQEEQHGIELQQQASLKELAQKASDINNDIIRLSRRQDYEAIKAKFTELENTVIAVKTLKDEMGQQKDRQERGRQRQKKLTEELERQKRLYENDRLLGLHKEETMKVQKSEKGSVRERQAKLEARRKAVRKQLDDGLEAMYQEALSLYKRGDYTAAADKFKDVQDIMLGYKRSEQYMGEARRKSLNVNFSGSRQDAVSKGLDLFDRG